MIKLYARQLMTKAKLQDDTLPSERKHVPSLQQWLQVVGLGPESIRVCLCMLEVLCIFKQIDLRRVTVQNATLGPETDDHKWIGIFVT